MLKKNKKGKLLRTLLRHMFHVSAKIDVIPDKHDHN